MEENLERSTNPSRESPVRAFAEPPLPKPSRKKPAGPALAPTLANDAENLSAKLASAARSLVEALDGSVPRNLEKKFAGGDTNIYLHRLARLPVEALSLEIRNRYPSEKLVRGRVDAWVRLFERLMDVLAETPEDTGLLEKCRASEAGHLYAVLAGATGKRTGRI